MKTIKCISLWQPWASLCCIEHPEDPGKCIKGFETRSWSTQHRGAILIHAAKRLTRDQQDFCYEDLIYDALWMHYNSKGNVLCANLPTGAIIGKVDLVECHPSEAMREVIDEYAEAMGDYSHGRYAWEIVNPILLGEPIPYRGQQGLFNVPYSVLKGSI